jgi:hypothetical protein
MKTMTILGALLAASTLAGCAASADSTDAAPEVREGATHVAGYALPTCADPSGFCISTIPAPSYLPPRGGFDADARGLYYISYRPDYAGAPDYYTALHVDFDGHLVSQSGALPGRPQVQNPVVLGNYFTFGEGTRNAVMDYTGANAPFLTDPTPYPKYPDMHPNGGVILGDGRYLSTTAYGGSLLGMNGNGTWAYPIECGPDVADQCQRPATDNTPYANGYIVAWPGGIQRIGVASALSRQQSYTRCNIPASWSRVSSGAPLASASDVPQGGMHAAFRLDDGTLVDCRDTGTAPVLSRVSLPATARNYQFDGTGALWIALMDLPEMAVRWTNGSVSRIALTTAQPNSTIYDEYKPIYVKVLPDDSVVVLTAGSHFLRIKRRGA